MSRDDISTQRRIELFGLLAVLALALVLRLRHLDTLFPWFLFEDELRTTRVTLHLLKEHTLDPEFTFYPALGFYLNAIVYYLWAAVGQLGLVLARGPGVVLDLFTGMSSASPLAIMLSRWVSILFALGSLVFSHLLARQFLSARWALFATLLIALNTMHLYISGVAKVDAINLFMFAAGFYFGLMYLRKGGLERLVLAAAFAGLSAVTKNYYQLCIALFLALLWRLWWGRSFIDIFRLKEPWIAFGTMLAFAFIGSPYSFIRIEQTLINAGWLYRQAEVISFYHTDPHVWWLDRYYYLISIVLPFIFGLPLFWIMVAAIGFHARKWALKDPYIFVNLVWYTYIIASGSGGPSGGAFPYYLFLNIIPLGVIVAVEWMKDLSLSGRRLARGFSYALCALVLAWSLLRVDAYRRMFLSHYEWSGQWLFKNVSSTERVLMLGVHHPTKALAIENVKTVWPQDFRQELIDSYAPDVLVIDSWAVAGFRKVYRDMWVAPLVDSLVSGEEGCELMAVHRPQYFNRAYYAALDPEHDVSMMVLKRKSIRTGRGDDD